MFKVIGTRERGYVSKLQQTRFSVSSSAVVLCEFGDRAAAKCALERGGVVDKVLP